MKFVKQITKVLFLLFFTFSTLCAGNKEVFSNVYKEGIWGKNEEGIGFSGAGSTTKAATPFMQFLHSYLKKHKVRSVVDLGCGDWTFSRHCNWDQIQYTGIDVVESLIEKNQRKFGRENIQFICGDATEIDLPDADLLICKDVLQHLSNEDVLKLLNKCQKYRLCVFVNDVDPVTRTSENGNISSGGYRFLDLRRKPFCVKGQVAGIYEVYPESDQGPSWIKSIFCVENMQ